MIDNSLIGKEYPEFSFEIEKGKIREFARAIGDKNPLYSDIDAAKEEGFESLALPPTLPTVFAAMSEGMQVIIGDLNIDLTKMLHGGQQYEYIKPIKPGDTVTGKAKIADIFEKKGKSGIMDFVVIKTAYTNQDGEKVLIDTSTLIQRR